MKTFNVGDIVRCIPGQNGPSIGYTNDLIVTRIRTRSDGEPLLDLKTTDDHYTLGWLPYRFQRVFKEEWTEEFDDKNTKI